MPKVFRVLGSVVIILLIAANVHAGVGLMAESDWELTPSPDQALIVFMRAGTYGGCSLLRFLT
jgi:hypothetical protein